MFSGNFLINWLPLPLLALNFANLLQEVGPFLMDGNSGKGADWKHPYAPLTPRNRDRPNDCSNAFTQMFFLVEPLRKYYIENTDKGAFHSSLGVLFEEMCTIGQSQESFTNANGILVTLDPNSGSYIPQVEELIQEADDYGNTPFVDAFKWLQSRITDTLNEVNRIRKVSPQPVNNAQEAWKYYQNNVDNTIIADLLAIQWTENFSGSECGHQNDRWLHENHLGFSISSGPTDERQRVPTVGDYLYEFLSVQTIVDKCPQCNCKQTGILSRSVTRFPPFFLVNIRRFDKKGNKDCSPLGIDLQLKLSNERQYRLNNAILHKGTATNGFYSTLAREAPNQWAVLMDQTVVSVRKVTLFPHFYCFFFVSGETCARCSGGNDARSIRVHSYVPANDARGDSQGAT